MKLLLVIFILAFLGINSFAQCSTKSMQRKLEKANEIRRSAPKKSRALAASALKCAESMGEFSFASRSLNLLGFHRLMEGNTEDAYKDFSKSLNLSEKAKNDTLIAIAENNLGNYYNYLGLDELALEHYLNSLRRKRKVGMLGGIDVGLVNIGTIYDKQGKHVEAIDFYKEALEIKRRKKDTYGIALVYENLGIAYAEMEDFENALTNFDRAVQGYDSLDYHEGVYSIELSKAALFVSKNDYEKSLEILQNIQSDLFAGTDVAKMQLWYQTMFNVTIAKGQYKESMTYADSALVFAKKTDELQSIINAFSDLAKVHTLTGDRLSALEYGNRALELKDSLSKLSNQVAIEELQLRYETEVLNNRIELQQKDIVLLNLKNRNRLYLIVLISAVALVIIASVLWRYRRNLKQKRALRIELDQRNKELLSFTVQTAKKNEAIQRLKETVASDDRSIQHLFKEVERTEDDWQEFRMRFEKIEPEFFQLLSKRFQLSETDLRISALIRLNVTTQEAANMLNITAESVNKARYRLRKKLDLPKDVDLNSFIRNFS
jgi:tetratricopeptide (TPR) repeat protein